MDIALVDIEGAINYWRQLRPSHGEERALAPEVNALAEIYALMIWERRATMPRERVPSHVLDLIEAWRGKRV